VNRAAPGQVFDRPALSEGEQLDFFDRALEAALRAGAGAGAIEHRFALGDSVVRIVFAGDALRARFLPAIAHLEIEPGTPAAATFHVWEGRTTGVPMPPPPCTRACFTDRGDIWGMQSARVRSAFHWADGSVNLLDLARAVGLYWVPDDRHLPFWSEASPLRTLLHWWLQHRGLQLLHAAAVGDADGAMLITGRGGVGKSTTALACLRAGMRYLGDDYVVIGRSAGPTVHALYATAKLSAAQLGAFPSLAELVSRPARSNEEKAVLQLWPRYRSQMPRALPIRAIATPSFRDTRVTRLVPAGSPALQRAAAFTTLSQLPHAGQATVDFVEQLVAAVPGHEIALGRDLDGIPRVVLGGLRESAAPAAAGGQRSTTRRPLVSVIVPVYNGAAFIGEAIESILAQRHAPLEIIVVDDGSTDALADALARLPVEVRLFRQSNEGPAAARNRGIRDAAGELLAFLDVDDLWPAGTLELLVSRLQADPTLDVVHGYAQLLQQQGDTGGYESVGNPREAFPWYLGAAVYQRRAFERVGLLDPTLRFGEDSDWFKRADEHGLAIERLDAVTLHVRRHAGNMTRGKSLLELNTLRVFKKALDRQRRTADEPGAQAP
jgi:GT2 family glycosyltransferase